MIGARHVSSRPDRAATAIKQFAAHFKWTQQPATIGEGKPPQSRRRPVARGHGGEIIKKERIVSVPAQEDQLGVAHLAPAPSRRSPTGRAAGRPTGACCIPSTTAANQLRRTTDQAGVTDACDGGKSQALPTAAHTKPTAQLRIGPVRGRPDVGAVLQLAGRPTLQTTARPSMRMVTGEPYLSQCRINHIRLLTR